MKYAVVFIEGAADLPQESLEDRTPLETASLPNTAALARAGRVGAVLLSPEPFASTADVSLLSLLGYDPVCHDPGPAGVRAAAWGVQLGGSETALCLDLLGEGEPGGDEEGLARDSGVIGPGETSVLVKDLLDLWNCHVGGPCKGWAIGGVRPGRAVLIDTATADWSKVNTTPPECVMWRDWSTLTPHGRAPLADALEACVRQGTSLLRSHEINVTRREQGLGPALIPWLWGPGRVLSLPPFRERFGLRGAMFCASEEAAAVARAAGWEVDLLDAEDLTRITARAARAIRGVDLVCVHPHAATGPADPLDKVASLQQIDSRVVGPLAAAMEQFGNSDKDPGAVGWRLLLAAGRGSAPAPAQAMSPFLMTGAWIRSLVARGFSEAAAEASDLQVSPGWELMEYFLRSGMVGGKGARGRRAR